MYIPIHLFILAFFMWVYDRLTTKKAADRFNSYASVNIIAGKTGSGKTFSAIKEMLDFKRKFPDGLIFSNVVTNLVDAPLTLDCFYDVFDVPVLIVVDEANSAYGAKLKSDVPDGLKKTLMQIRKGVGKRVLLLAQDYSLLDTNFRKLAHFVYESKTYMGRLTSCRCFEQQTYETHYQVGGVSYDKQKQPRRKSSWILQTKKVRSLYDYKAVVDVDWYKTGDSA